MKSKTTYHYHYYAFWQDDRVIRQYDGIASMPFQVLTFDNYRSVKSAIIAQEGADIDPKELTLASLSLLAIVER